MAFIPGDAPPTNVARGLSASVFGAGGRNDITAVTMWVNQQGKGNWNFFSFCQVVRFGSQSTAVALQNRAPAATVWQPAALHGNAARGATQPLQMVGQSRNAASVNTRSLAKPAVFDPAAAPCLPR